MILIKNAERTRDKKNQEESRDRSIKMCGLILPLHMTEKKQIEDKLTDISLEII